MATKKNQMMKNKNLYTKYTLLLAVVFAAFSCGDINDYAKVTQEYVGFETTAAEFSEVAVITAAEGTTDADNSYEVVLVRSTTDYSEAVSVSLSFTATYVDSTAFADDGDDASADIYFSEDISNITFAADEAEARFTVFSKNDGNSTGNRAITFTINSVSSADYSIGYAQAGINSGSLSLTLVDDDCPIPSLVGTYNVVLSSANPGGCAGRPTTVEVALVSVIDQAAGEFVYSITDITGGMYTECYSNAAGNPAEFTTSGFDIILTNQPDVVYPPDRFDGTGKINCDGSFTIEWGNGFGDAGVSVHTK